VPAPPPGVYDGCQALQSGVLPVVGWRSGADRNNAEVSPRGIGLPRDQSDGMGLCGLPATASTVPAGRPDGEGNLWRLHDYRPLDKPVRMASRVSSLVTIH
jgi:hypothetical protein